MTREELTVKYLSSSSRHFILQLPTSFGKTKLALQKADSWFTESAKILIVIPRNVLIKEWKKEIVKWGYDRMIGNITFTTYISLPKQLTVFTHNELIQVGSA